MKLEILEGLPVIGGQAYDLVFGIYTDEGDPINQIEKDHGKYMHMNVVSMDRSYFAHTHPIWLGRPNRESNLFKLTVNSPTVEFDNFQAPVALPTKGVYMLYSEVVPKGSHTPSVAEYKLEVLSGPDPSPTVQDDKVGHDKTISKYLKMGKKGTAETAETTHEEYQLKATIKSSVMDMGDKKMIHFDFQLFRKHQMAGHKMDIPIKYKELINWLGMPGHAILVSENHDDFFHLHYPDMKHQGGGGQHSMLEVDPETTQFRFMLAVSNNKYDHLKKKNFSIWAQFRISDTDGAPDINSHGIVDPSVTNSRISTIPFRFNLEDLKNKKGSGDDYGRGGHGNDMH